MPGKRRRSLRISDAADAAARSQEIIVMKKGRRNKNKMMKRGGGLSSEEEEEEDITKYTVGAVEGATTVLPEKVVLELILDTLQRRDIYDLFGEPLDPLKCDEEDYYTTIRGQGGEAMDFGTMRAKLHEGMYTSFQQFQYDVLLITRNAMRFNQSTTTFYKQAHVIDEVAKKVFHLLLTSPNPEEFKQQLIQEDKETALAPIRIRRRRRSSSSRTTRLPTRVLAASTARNRRPSSSSVPVPGYPSSSCTAAVAKSSSNQLPQFDRRSTYHHIGTHQDNTPTTNIQGLQLIVQHQQQEQQADAIIGYRESLTQFVKDLGPTAKKVAKMKLLPLCNVSALSGGTMTLSTTTPLGPIASDHHHSTAAPITNAADAAPLHHAVRSHLQRAVVLALPCSTDNAATTRKKAATSSSSHINPGICIRKNRPPPPPPPRFQDKLQQDSCLNNNSNRINRHHHVLTTSTTIPMTVGDAAQQASQSRPPLIPSAPQFKFDLQFLQTRLHQMKSDERPPPPPPAPLLLQDNAPNAGRQSSIMATSSNNDNSMQDLVDIYRAHLSLQR